MESYQGFEQGPIRPPSEASSLLLRLTRNCPWNRCSFCSVYKGEKFSFRPVEDIIRDIDTVHRLVNELREAPMGSTSHLRGSSPPEEYAYFAACNWIAGGMKSVFLQDADSMVMKPADLIRILQHIKVRFPMVERITTYSRSRSVARLREEDLREIAAAGLNRIHIGMETGSDKILALVKKGATKEIHIRAGIKAREAGFEVSEYVLTGLGGREFWRDHAIETADALSRINPHFIRFRNLHILDSLNLFENAENEEYQWSSDLILAKEILLLLENLEGITSCIKSDHMLNLFQEIDGALPEDKDRLASVPRSFIEMEPEQRALYQVGKRTGHFWRLQDLENVSRRQEVENLCRRIGITAENVDDHVHALVQERMKSGMRM